MPDAIPSTLKIPFGFDTV